MRSLFLPAAIALALSSSLVSAADEQQSLDNLTRELIALRGQVNDLADQLELNNEAHKQTVRSLMMQKSGVESSLRQERLSLKKLQEQFDSQTAEIGEKSAGSSGVKDILLGQGEELKARISTGLPFRTSERLAAVDDLLGRIRTDAVSPYRGANELWSLFEDELRLTRENGIFSQTVAVDGEDVLADIARVGMMMMYFRLDGERYGYFKREGESWNTVMISDEQASRQVSNLFDAFSKQIRSGSFVLPNAL